ncbi:MAG TPA: LysR family transcriptional regulator [Sandaracinaceae bacterium LLY-WYZ-13_1]|nr:LysR family transcriptional regulator [Sandaracinaceae bacterium LLY-WYZ-13_1]
MPEPDLLATPLRYFRQVAESGSFTAAARVLHVSQPSLSVAVRKLEEALGAPLLHRSRQGVSPTRAGEILLEHARQAERTLEAARSEMRSLDTEPRGRFTLGAHESLAAYLLPGFMARFLERYPEVRLELDNGNSREVERAVVERRLDVGLVVNPSRHPDCVVVELFEDRVGFVVSAARRRRAKTSPRGLLTRLPLIHVPVLRQTQYLLGALATAGIEPPSQLTCSSMELVKSLVLDGVGVGVLPYRVASHGVSAGRLSHLGASLPVFDDVITLVRRYDLPMTAGARVLVDGLREHAASMAPLPEVLRP